MGSLRADAIFDDLSRESDNNCINLAKKVCDMARSSVAKNIVTLNAASDSLEIIALLLELILATIP